VRKCAAPPERPRLSGAGRHGGRHWCRKFIVYNYMGGSPEGRHDGPTIGTAPGPYHI